MIWRLTPRSSTRPLGSTQQASYQFPSSVPVAAQFPTSRWPLLFAISFFRKAIKGIFSFKIAFIALTGGALFASSPKDS